MFSKFFFLPFRRWTQIHQIIVFIWLIRYFVQILFVKVWHNGRILVSLHISFKALIGLSHILSARLGLVFGIELWILSIRWKILNLIDFFEVFEKLFVYANVRTFTHLIDRLAHVFLFMLDVHFLFSTGVKTSQIYISLWWLNPTDSLLFGFSW